MEDEKKPAPDAGAIAPPAPAHRPPAAAPEPAPPRTAPGDAGGGRARKANAFNRLRPREIHDRITLYIIRGLFFLIAAGLGLYTSRLFNFPAENLLVTIPIACGFGLVVMIGEMFFSRAPIRTLSSIVFGLIIGLAFSFLFQSIVEVILNAFGPTEVIRDASKLLQLVTATIFCYYGVTVLLQTKDDFQFIIPYVQFRKDVKGHTPYLIDTSAIIDGRIAKLLETNIIDQRLVVPKFVLNELQLIADSPDRSKRERGRRGMDILESMRRKFGVEILERELPRGSEVDRELLSSVDELKGKLLTTDYNLQKRADLVGIPVININDLATALKPVFVPGEQVRVKLLRVGDEPEQAIGFLDDGTMVVVERSSRRIGQEVTVEVTSATQTSAGKMIFGKLPRFENRGPSRPPDRRRRDGGRERDRGERDPGGGRDRGGDRNPGGDRNQGGDRGDGPAGRPDERPTRAEHPSGEG